MLNTKSSSNGVILIFYLSFLSNEQVYFFFFQMNEFLVILKLKMHQNICLSKVVFLKCLKKWKNADFWLLLQFNKGLFCRFGTTGVNKKWHFFFGFDQGFQKIKKKFWKSKFFCLLTQHTTKCIRVWCNPE